MSKYLTKSSSTILNELRRLMNSKEFYPKRIDAYIIPSSDPHQNEYIPNKFKRREFISKFSGSNGTVLVTENKALLWTDGRYFIQADIELDKNHWTLMKEGLTNVPTMTKWLIQNMDKNSLIAVDPELVSISQWNSWKSLFEENDLELVSIERNLVDSIWSDQREDLPNNPIWIYPLENAGLSVDQKLNLVREKLIENNVKHLIVHRNDDVAWLFNLRGGDIDYNPVFLSFSIVSSNSCRIYLDKKKTSNDVREHLDQNNIQIFDYEIFYDHLREISSDLNNKDKYLVSPSCNSLVLNILGKKRIVIQEDLVYQLKAIKTDKEIQGMKRAHIKDGLALSRFFQWLEEKIDNDSTLSEMSCADQLQKFRSENENYLFDSFECISAFASNGSIIHYRANEETNKKIDKSSLFLVDSGGQYLEGTTDVTRTIHLGHPTSFEKECFTRVLKGMISLSRCVFPPRTIGARLDSFARRSLWEIGLDYPHGTGHGVGTCLNVHEGPQSIGIRMISESFLCRGMVLSNEPGFYLKDKFGIRIENCIVVVENKKHFNNDLDNIDWLTFEQLTMVPIQLKLIEKSLLDENEISFLNNYHQQVYDLLSKEMIRLNYPSTNIEWLRKNTQPI